MGKSIKDNSQRFAAGGGIIVAAIGVVGYLLKKQKQRKAVKLQNVELLKQEEKLNAFGKQVEELFSNNLSNKLFCELKRDKLFLTRDEKFQLIESLLRDYEKVFKKEFNLTKAFFDFNGNLKGEKEAEKIKYFFENMSENPYKEKLIEKAAKYNVDINAIINSVLNVNKSQIKEITGCILKDYNMLKAGVEGEERVIRELDKFSDEYKIFSNIRLKVRNDEIEFDNLIITDRGIVIIEVKNIGENGDRKLVVTKDGQYKKIKNGHEQVLTGYTPTSQLYHHTLKLTNLLKNELRERKYKHQPINIKPIVVIANDNIKIENNSETTIIRVSEIFHHIFENDKKGLLNRFFNKKSELSIELQNEIYDIITSNTVKDKKYETDIPRDIISTAKSNLEVIKFIKDFSKLIEAW